MRALSCTKGTDEISAFCLAAKADCLPRFPTAPEQASWCRLIPSEHSSDEREARGHITKTGNAASRRTLVEGAWHHAGCLAGPKRLPGERDVPAVMRPRGNACATRLAAVPARRKRHQPFRRRLRPRARLLGLGDRPWGGRHLSQAAVPCIPWASLPGGARDLRHTAESCSRLLFWTTARPCPPQRLTFARGPQAKSRTAVPRPLPIAGSYDRQGRGHKPANISLPGKRRPRDACPQAHAWLEVTAGRLTTLLSH